METAPQSKAILWTGRVLTTIIFLFLSMGVIMYFTSHKMLIDTMTKYGYSEHAGTMICFVEFAIAVLIVIPQTAVFGTVLLTAYLGGAVSTHVRAGEHFVQPIIFCTAAWAAMMMRERRLWELFPIRK